MKIESEQAKEALCRLNSAGFEAYLVGGCVRDAVMGISGGDIDVTTSALPEETEAVFSDFHVIETGIRHGTVTVVIGSVPVEITTFRTESGYSDNRRPDGVSFSTRLSDDLSRRDFTMNAICYSEKTGIIDLFGGMSDIENRLIRCIGNPRERFHEDALRILRAVRFASKLGFRIESETAAAMYECMPLLSKLSAERVYSELVGILCGKHAGAVLTEYFDIISFLLPEITKMKGFDQHNFHHIYDVLNHTARVVDAIEPVPHLRLAAFFHDCAKPDCFTLDENGVGHFYSHAPKGACKAAKILKRLKADSRTCERVEKLVRIHDSPIDESVPAVKRKLSRLGEDLFFELVSLQRADTAGLSPEFFSRFNHYDELECIAGEIIKENQCFSLKDLAVDGNDLLSLGLSGRQVGETLQKLLSAVIDGKAENERETLLTFLDKK